MHETAKKERKAASRAPVHFYYLLLIGVVVSESLTWHGCAESGGWVLCIGAGQHQFG